MGMRILTLCACVLLALVATGAQAFYLSERYEQAPFPEALSRVKAQPGKHVMVYFSMERGCPPCNYTRNMLNGPDVLDLYRKDFVVVTIDLRSPASDAERALIAKYKARWAPTLVFLDGSGRELARFARGFSNVLDAQLLHEFMTRKLYTKTTAQAYITANFNAEGTARVIPEGKAAVVSKPFEDDRMTVADVKKLPHERVSAEDLRTRLAGSKLDYHSRLKRPEGMQTWQGTWTLDTEGGLVASSQRMDKPGSNQGKGKWRVQDDGQLCYEIAWASNRNVDTCVWVFRVGDEFYLAPRDHPASRIYLRWTLAAE
jgi:thioredoxin-related protein